MGRLGCGEKGIDLSKDVVVVESEAKVLPTLLMASTSHLKCLTRTHISDIFSSELAVSDAYKFGRLLEGNSIFFGGPGGF